ncbi:hypothetical protein N9Y33_04330 [Bacteroidia bacterium]|nr:hypothetical protein [Bacteroidia bacterium]
MNTARNEKAIVYVGGYWATNIGNAFYDFPIGIKLKEILGNRLTFLSDLNVHVWKNAKNALEILDLIDAEMLLFSGPIFNVRFGAYKSLLQSCARKGIEVGFISAGGNTYSHSEVTFVKKILKESSVRIRFLSTRDEKCYEKYSSVAMKVYNGICFSAFLNDVYVPPKLDSKHYAFAFSYRHEPNISVVGDRFYFSKKRFWQRFSATLNGDKIVRLNHYFFTPFSLLQFNRPNMFYSDMPFGYLTIYASAITTISDRVHACAATMAYGGKSIYTKGSNRSKDGRNLLFDRMKVKFNNSREMYYDMDYISNEKINQLKFLNEVF